MQIIEDQTQSVNLALSNCMSEVMAKFSFDKPDSALSRLAGRVEFAL